MINFERMKRALLIVDVQNDFCPGGALPAVDGHKIIPVINKIMDSFDVVIASKDWHPADTVHFKVWPPHCVQNTKGAEFPETLSSKKITQTFLKGTRNSDDGYSAFESTNLNLENWLKENKIDELYLAGIATEYCVKQSSRDALEAGFKVSVITDAVAAIDAHEGDGNNALQELAKNGARLINSSFILNQPNN